MDVKTFVRANWDRVAAVVLVIVGAVVLVLGWIGVSGTGLAAEQNPYLISGGVAGIAFIAVGCTIWLSSDLQDEWRRLDALDERLGELLAAQGQVPAESANGKATGGTIEDVALDVVSEKAPSPTGRRAVQRVSRTPTA